MTESSEQSYIKVALQGCVVAACDPGRRHTLLLAHVAPSHPKVRCLSTLVVVKSSA